MRRAVEQRAHEAGRGIERSIGPDEDLAERPIGAALQVAGGGDALGQRAPAGRDVGEEAAGDHVVGVALGGERQLGVLAHGRDAAGGALGVDDADKGGASLEWGEARADVVGMCARCSLSRPCRQSDDNGAEHGPDGVLAVHLAPKRFRAPGAPKFGSPGGGRSSPGGARRSLSGSRSAPPGRSAALSPRGARRPPSYPQSSCRKPPPTTRSRPCSRA